MTDKVNQITGVTPKESLGEELSGKIRSRYVPAPGVIPLGKTLSLHQRLRRASKTSSLSRSLMNRYGQALERGSARGELFHLVSPAREAPVAGDSPHSPVLKKGDLPYMKEKGSDVSVVRAQSGEKVSRTPLVSKSTETMGNGKKRGSSPQSSEKPASTMTPLAKVGSHYETAAGEKAKTLPETTANRDVAHPANRQMTEKQIGTSIQQTETRITSTVATSGNLPLSRKDDRSIKSMDSPSPVRGTVVQNTSSADHSKLTVVGGEKRGSVVQEKLVVRSENQGSPSQSQANAGNESSKTQAASISIQPDIHPSPKKVDRTLKALGASPNTPLSLALPDPASSDKSKSESEKDQKSLSPSLKKASIPSYPLPVMEKKQTTMTQPQGSVVPAPKAKASENASQKTTGLPIVGVHKSAGVEHTISSVSHRSAPFILPRIPVGFLKNTVTSDQVQPQRISKGNSRVTATPRSGGQVSRGFIHRVLELRIPSNISGFAPSQRRGGNLILGKTLGQVHRPFQPQASEQISTITARRVALNIGNTDERRFSGKPSGNDPALYEGKNSVEAALSGSLTVVRPAIAQTKTAPPDMPMPFQRTSTNREGSLGAVSVDEKSAFQTEAQPTSTSSSPPAQTPVQTPASCRENLRDIADQVYDILVERLSVERESLGG